MTENDDTKWIMCGLGIAIIAFFTFLVFKTTNQIQPSMSISAMEEFNRLNLLQHNQYLNPTLQQNNQNLQNQQNSQPQQNQFQLIEQKLQQLENKIDNFNNERKTVSIGNDFASIGNRMNINRFTASDHKLIQNMFDMK